MRVFETLKQKVRITIHFDGACHNKAGGLAPMGIGVCANLSVDEKVLIAEYKGLGTSNVAEWEALCRALELARELTRTISPVARMYIFRIIGDSQLIINQFNGVFRIKEQSFDPYYVKAHKLVNEIESEGHKLDCVEWTRRQNNAIADTLSKEGLAKNPDRDKHSVKYVVR